MSLAEGEVGIVYSQDDEMRLEIETEVRRYEYFLDLPSSILLWKQFHFEGIKKCMKTFI